MRALALSLAFCIALIVSAFAQGGMGPGPGTVHTTGGGGHSIAFTSVASNCDVMPSCAGSGTYTGTVPTSITSATWNTTCTGSSTVSGFTASGGTWSATFTTPAAQCAGTLGITDNLSDTATSPSATVSAWLLIATTGVGYSGSLFGGTTPAIDTTGANIIVLENSEYNQSFVLSDSKGNTYTLANQQTSVCTMSLSTSASPTVGTGHTFSWSTSPNNSFGVLNAQAWKDRSGTPAFSGNNTGASATASSLATGTFTHSPTKNNTLNITGVCNQSAPTTISGVSAPFTAPANNIQPTVAGQSISGGMAYYAQGADATLNPTWTLTGSDSIAVGIMSINP